MKPILKKILQAEPHPIGTYCFECGVDNVKTLLTEHGEEFLCSNNHQSPRAYIFDNKTVTNFEEAQLVHFTVGAIIKKASPQDTLYLLFLRQKFPFLYTIPAGHLEQQQNIQSEVIREIKEETALTVVSITQLWQSPLRLFDPCRRGADNHYWYVFEATTSGEPQLSDEGRSWGWYSRKEIEDFAEQNLLIAPLNTIFNKYWSVE